jgi:hypothetical protein
MIERNMVRIGLFLAEKAEAWWVEKGNEIYPAPGWRNEIPLRGTAEWTELYAQWLEHIFGKDIK